MQFALENIIRYSHSYNSSLSSIILVFKGVLGFWGFGVLGFWFNGAPFSKIN